MKGQEAVNDHFLQMAGITKIFPGVTALQKVDLNVNKGELHGLVGENGAGKSTLMNVLGGILRPTEGTIRIDGREAVIPSPSHADALGIGFVHQEPNLLGNLSVMENIFLAREKSKRFGCLNKREMAEKVAALSARLGYELDPFAQVGGLNLARRQSVEIARAVMNSPKILILDEPTAALDEDEVAHLFRLIDMLKSEGVSIIYISHRLDEVVKIADRVTVLKDGRLIDCLEKNEINKDAMISMMVGRVLMDIYPDRSDIITGDKVLSVNNLTIKGAVEDLSFHVSAGEIVGLGGLEGQGQRAAARAIFGELNIVKGSVTANDVTYHGKGIARRIRCGLGYITHDRRGEGLVYSLSLAKNSSLASLHRLRTSLGVIRKAQERSEVLENIERMQIKATSMDQSVQDLSGGNQQKTMLSRWLMTKPRVLLIDEPTKGVDVGARMSVYNIIDKLTREGMGIVMITSDMMELIGLSDRILIFYEGKIQRELTRAEATEEKIMRAASGYVEEGT